MTPEARMRMINILANEVSRACQDAATPTQAAYMIERALLNSGYVIRETQFLWMCADALSESAVVIERLKRRGM